jgi:hypothetical protein
MTNHVVQQRLPVEVLEIVTGKAGSFTLVLFAPGRAEPVPSSATLARCKALSIDVSIDRYRPGPDGG